MEKQQSKPNWLRRHKVITSVVCAFLVIAFLGSLVKDDKPTVDKQSSKAQVETPKPPEKPKTWQKVAELSGTTEKKSPVFQLTGAEARMTYSATGGDFGVFAIYIMKDGSDLHTDGGVPDLTTTKPISDETRVTRPAGSYYLDVSSTFDYTITIEELR